MVGALIWAAILHFTEYEVGLVAWGIGGLVGFASAALGGFGAANGGLCALVAVLAIFAGKMIVIKSQLADMEPIFRPGFEIVQLDAKAFTALNSSEDYPQFMLEHEYTESTSAAGISSAELALFESETAPMLRSVDEGMSYKQWMKSIIPMGEIIKESFGVMSIVFLFLGVATAFKVGSGLGDEA